MVWRPGSVRHSAKIIIERMVLLHHHDDVAYFGQPHCLRRGRRSTGSTTATAAASCRGHAQNQHTDCSQTKMITHRSTPSGNTLQLKSEGFLEPALLFK